MRENVKKIMVALKFPEETQKELLLVLDKFLETPEFSEIIESYYTDGYVHWKLLDATKELAKSKGICEYGAQMVFLLCIVPKFYERWQQKGLSDRLFYDTICSIKYHLDECWLIHHKHGTFVADCYGEFFAMTIFQLGRLQFQLGQTWFEAEVDGVHIPKGKKVICIHIPRSGVRLDHDLVLDSYRQAQEFFKDEFEGEEMMFVCGSWLLYPWNRTVFKEGSNLAQFYDDFIIVGSDDREYNREVWRLFDCMYDGNPDHLPADTSLRRSYVERIRAGLPIGHGDGVLKKEVLEK